MKENNVRQISEREHILLRPNRYIGSTKPSVRARYTLVEGDSGYIFKWKDVKFSPGLLKIVDEVIDNAVDEAIRTKYKFANKITVVVKPNSILVGDNGRGIPIINADGSDVLMPVLAWTALRAGANFDDEDDAMTGGQNGEGVTLTNVFSKVFSGITIYKGKVLSLEAKNNMGKVKHTVGEAPTNAKSGTTVYFEPDLKIFNIKEIKAEYVELIRTRLLALSITHPKIKFSLNGEKVKYDIQSMAKMFHKNSLYASFRDVDVIVAPNDNESWQFMHYINGLDVYDKSVPLDEVMKDLLTPILEKLKRKWKTITMADIKNKLQVVVIFRNMVKPRFENQIKTSCVNTKGDINPNIDDMDFTDLRKDMLKSDDIMIPIEELFKLKEKAKSNSELKKKLKRKHTSEKYMPATGVNKYLVLGEGQCMSPSTIVKTPDGTKTLEEIAIGDYVINSDGSKQEVYARWHTKKSAFLITTSSTTSILSAEHRLWYYDARLDKEVFVTTKEVMSDKHDRYKMMVHKRVEDITSIVGVGEMELIDISVRGDATFMLANGILSHNSAVGGISAGLGREEFSYYELKGKPVNVKKHSEADLLKKAELMDLLATVAQEKPEYIMMGTDADLDGCFAGSTKIATLHGQKLTFSNLVENFSDLDQVVMGVNDDGTITPTITTYPRITKYVDTLVELTFNRSTPIKVTTEHLWPVIGQTTDDHHIWVKSSDLKKGMEVVGWLKGLKQSTTIAVKKVGLVKLNIQIPVYDLTSNQTQNFTVDVGADTGVCPIAHNSHITTLSMGIVHKYFKEYIDNGKFGRIRTPMIVELDKTGDIILQCFYSFEEYQHGVKENSKMRTKYLKGLGSLEDGWIDQIIALDGIDKMLEIFVPDDKYEYNLAEWLDEDSVEFRKKAILNNNFNLTML